MTIEMIGPIYCSELVSATTLNTVLQFDRLRDTDAADEIVGHNAPELNSWLHKTTGCRFRCPQCRRNAVK